MLGFSVAYLIEEKYNSSSANEEYVSSQPFSKDIVIKIPVPVPYQIDWDAPESAEGKIRHQGEYYKMKTRQLINDTMYVHCEYDQNARDRFMSLVSQINDVAGIDKHSDKRSHSITLKNFLKEYMSSNKKHVFYLIEFCLAHSFVSDQCGFISKIAYLSIPSPPPDLT